MRKLWWGILLLMVASVLFSCRSQRSVYKAPIKMEGAEYLLTQLESHELKYETFSSKVSIHYLVGNKKTSFKGSIRIKRDSLIWLSIAPVMGIELARVLITPDSIKVIDRAHKTYIQEDYEYVNNYLNNALDFDMLQAFLVGNDFSFFEESTWRTNIDGGLYKLATAKRQKLKKYVRSHEAVEIPIQNTWLDPKTFKIRRVDIKEIADNDRGRKLSAKYADFFIVDSQMFPLHVEFNLRAETNVNIFMDYSRVVLNQYLKYPFHISSKYTRETFE